MPRIAFLFPGQGAQFAGMGQSLCESLPAARQLFETAAGSSALTCWISAQRPGRAAQRHRREPAGNLRRELGGLEYLKASEPAAVSECSATAGLSLGEYTALTFAGASVLRMD